MSSEHIAWEHRELFFILIKVPRVGGGYWVFICRRGCPAAIHHYLWALSPTLVENPDPMLTGGTYPEMISISIKEFEAFSLFAPELKIENNGIEQII